MCCHWICSICEKRNKNQSTGLIKSLRQRASAVMNRPTEATGSCYSKVANTRQVTTPQKER